jgi:hypothetical protein
MTGFSGHGNEPSDSVKGGKFHDHERDLLHIDSTQAGTKLARNGVLHYLFPVHE